MSKWQEMLSELWIFVAIIVGIFAYLVGYKNPAVVVMGTYAMGIMPMGLWDLAKAWPNVRSPRGRKGLMGLSFGFLALMVAVVFKGMFG